MRYLLGIILSLLLVTTVMSAVLVCDPYPTDGSEPMPTRFGVLLKADPPRIPEDQTFYFNYTLHTDGNAIVANLVNFPAGENVLEVWAENVWDKSTTVPFTFIKELPGISSGMALVNIDGVVYLTTDPQESIYSYRIIIDGIEYVVDAEDDGSLKVSLEGIEDGIHSIEIYAINMWGESNLAPFGFTKSVPSAPKNLLLSQ